MAKELWVVKNEYLLKGRELFCHKKKRQKKLMKLNLFFFLFIYFLINRILIQSIHELPIKISNTQMDIKYSNCKYSPKSMTSCQTKHKWVSNIQIIKRYRVLNKQLSYTLKFIGFDFNINTMPHSFIFLF